jgi:hypothetical protein
MPRRVLLGVIAGGLAVLVAFALLHRTARAFTLGVPPALPVVTLPAGQEACQQPIDVPGHAAFDRVKVAASGGSPLQLTIRDAGRHVVATGRLAGGNAGTGPGALREIRLDRTVATPTIKACVRNLGPAAVTLYGDSGLAARDSTAVRDGRPLPVDIAFVFERSPRSLAGLGGAIADRASLFRFPWLRGWVYFLLFAVLVVGGAALLVRALQTALPDER